MLSLACFWLFGLGTAGSGLEGSLDRAEEALRRVVEAESCEPTSVASLGDLAALFGKLGALEQQALALVELSDCLQENDRIEIAKELLGKALDLARGAEAGELERRILTSQAIAESSSGNLPAAVELFERALAEHQRAGDLDQEAQTLSHLGLAYSSRGSYELALDAFRRAREYFRRNGQRRQEGRVLVKMGNVYKAQGRRSAARTNLLEAVEASTVGNDLEARIFAEQLLVEMLLEAGEYEPADRRLRATIRWYRELDRPRLLAYALQQLSQCLRKLGRSEEAVAAAEEGLALHRNIGNPWGEIPAWTDLALALSARGDFARSLSAMEEAVAALERQRDRVGDPDDRALFLASNRRTAESLRNLLLAEHEKDATAGHARRALLAHERFLSRSLLEHLLPSPVEVPELDLGRLQAWVDERSKLVEIALGDDHSWAWIVGGSSFDLVELPPRQEIDQAVAGLRVGGEPGAKGPSPEALARLARLIWAPLEAKIEPGTRVLVVPDGSLRRVPFGALPDREGRPLMRVHELVIAPSARVALVLGERAEAAEDTGVDSEGVLVLADAVYRADDPRLGHRRPMATSPAEEDGASKPWASRLPRLRFSRREAEKIRQRLGPEEVSVRFDFEASKAAVVAASGRPLRILHIAAHALIDDESPERSGIMLSLFDGSGNPRDGFLGLEDIASLDLEVELVVLSACSSAIGREVWGEGLLSLTRAFLGAGARGVLATLWPVDDRSTAALMDELYRALAEPPSLHPSAALALAQRRLAAQPRFEDPSHWGAFVFQGSLR